MKSRGLGKMPRQVRKTARGMLTVCMGMPASGKSVWARANANGALVVCADAMRTCGVSAQALFGKMRRDAQMALLGGEDVIVDACSLQWRDREPWLAIARRLDASTRLVVFDVSAEVCRARDLRRAQPAGRIDLYAARMIESLHRIEREGWGSIEHVRDVGG